MFRLVLFIFLVSLHLCDSQKGGTTTTTTTKANPANPATPAIPPSPFGQAKDICPPAGGGNYTVGGWPGTPYPITPFQDVQQNPGFYVPLDKQCRSDGHCIYSYTVDVHDITLAVFNNIMPACAKLPPTKWLSYAGTIPGQTFVVPSGHELLVRFTNSMGKLLPKTFPPCNTTARTGRPFSVHHHGSASLSPYDGWAEDETCFNETKEYIYPDNRPTTQWYHDHALHTTADNAYLGLAGLYFVSAKIKHGGCGEPWNLEDVEEKHLILQDKVLDRNCQLFIDPTGAHLISLYGDINVVSGIPYPTMALQAKYYRFRFLNAAVSRPFLLQIRQLINGVYTPIQQNICFVIVTDGGYRETPVAMPASGMFIGVAERYEVVCDFRGLAGQFIYWWNDKDPAVQKDAPYFCYTHLIARMQIGALNATAPVFNPNLNPNAPERTILQVLNHTDIGLAQQMANNDQYHRDFQFGRGNGHWVINGQTWDTATIAASDVGDSTWELWRLEAGGGWFHPVHIHLVDFLILLRKGDGGLRPYEILSPKDVMYLGPGNTLYVLARWGPNLGDFMFHCHNLIHEDNDMMRAFSIVNTTQGHNNITGQPFITNKFFNIVYNNFKFASPLTPAVAARPTALMPTLNSAYLQQVLTNNVYRIFYPTAADFAQFGNFTNPWQSFICPTIAPLVFPTT